MPIGSTFTNKALSFDRAHIWHPYTSLSDPLPVYPVVSASGVTLKLASGAQLVDGMSSWWTAIHGYNVPSLNDAANRQLKNMAHVMFGGITHGPAISLCQKLTEITGLGKVFLCDSGSVSIEVAMKMAIQFQQAKGLPKKSFMTLSKGYHGDTTGAMSVCDPINGMHHLFEDFLPKHHFFDLPSYGFQHEPTIDELQSLKLFFEKHAGESAAFILEPIVQGAGGMNFYCPSFLKAIKALCLQYGLLLIADEIATGFGRSGKLFACAHAGLTPDIMCLGKALTGGYVTMAATLCTAAVAETIGAGAGGILMHGPTFMGNPLACAIADESIALLLEKDWEAEITHIEDLLNRELHKLIDLSVVKEVRILGAIGVVELVHDVEVAKAQAFFVENGVWIRPFRNLIYVMPPYIITASQLLLLTNAISAYLHHIGKG